MPEPRSNPANATERVSAARAEARRAAIKLARDHGAPIVARPAWPGAQTSVQDLAPLDGLRAAHDIELAARFASRGYARAAREAGHSWEQIGHALGLTPGADAQQAGESLAEAAYTYAAGNPDPDAPWRPRSFPWTCQSCEQAISDYGEAGHPADGEIGHADGCPRLAAAIAEWDKALDDGREAGR